jgi:23S rRNA pseudouridine1911/1915/1917 synthase
LLLSEKGADDVAPDAVGPFSAITMRTKARLPTKGIRRAEAAAAAFAADARARAAEVATSSSGGGAKAGEASGPAEAVGAEDVAGDVDELVEFEVEPFETSLRLDRLLSGRFPSQSRTYFGSLCAQQCVTLDGVALAKGAKLKEGSRVAVQFLATEEMEARPERMPLDIVFEDEHILVLNKAAGVVVHPAPGNWEGTLVNGVLYHLSASGGFDPTAERGALSLTSTVVHRLDKGTTGLIVFAKSGEAQRRMSDLFRLRKISKSYLAVCVGDPGEAPLDVALPIGRDRVNRLRMTVVPEDEGGRAARSIVRRLAHNGKFSLCRVDIFTGRTHQIRVHLRHHGLPILGDDEYGSKQWNQLALKSFRVKRPLLHAHRLAFAHPFTGEQLSFEATPPEDLERLAEAIRSTPGVLLESEDSLKMVECEIPTAAD